MGKRHDPAAHLEELGREDEERQAWALRRQGYSLDAIAERLGITRSSAFRRVAAARKRVTEETRAHVEEHRAEQLAQIDDVIATATLVKVAARKVMVDQDTGIESVEVDLASIIRADANILAALDRKAKLLGTYAVEKVEVSATVTHVDARDLELAAMLGVEAPKSEDMSA